MGTNYYLHEKPPCECCGRPFEELHIGKSSAGWCFGLHVIAEQGINSLEDWKARWSAPGAGIRNEYGDAVTPEEMLDCITNRGRPKPSPLENFDYTRNHAVPGPNNLLRHRIDGRHCIGHGEGTWDLIAGCFS